MTGLVGFRSVYFLFLCLPFACPSNTSSQFEHEFKSLRNEIQDLKSIVIRQEKQLIAQGEKLDALIQLSTLKDTSEEDQHSLKNAVEKLEEKFDRCVSQIASNKSSTTLAAKTTSPVCFTVVREINGHGVFTAIGKMPYERALLNVGNAMNITTGEFTAPIRGIYFFSLTICSNVNSWAKIYHNDVTVVLAETHGCEGCGAWNSGSAQATIELNAGDVVYTHLGRGHFNEYEKDHHNIFTGFLLHEL